jgi:hypothetical protein
MTRNITLLIGINIICIFIASEAFSTARFPLKSKGYSFPSLQRLSNNDREMRSSSSLQSINSDIDDSILSEQDPSLSYTFGENMKSVKFSFLDSIFSSFPSLNNRNSKKMNPEKMKELKDNLYKALG